MSKYLEFAQRCLDHYSLESFGDVDIVVNTDCAHNDVRYRYVEYCSCFSIVLDVYNDDDQFFFKEIGNIVKQLYFETKHALLCYYRNSSNVYQKIKDLVDKFNSVVYNEDTIEINNSYCGDDIYSLEYDCDDFVLYFNYELIDKLTLNHVLDLRDQMIEELANRLFIEDDDRYTMSLYIFCRSL